eukprot:gnl/MRDRNA2_/MRDRNA2_110372_c0_seq1.p1 gnl/MRDRNA2_/MRDRNA2_110372_c0~~gnl/MRDRNA2_/MRDRNA2_110372_c0_seq1.p1  ORF type:complete len:454 (+),score=96.98 gnl/MRDRNA2_/MRDRNA2_110372_c0_seq1:68-1429(+)
MTEPSDLISEGTKILKEANHSDQQGSYQEALQKYIAGLNKLQIGVKYSKDESIKPMLRQRMGEVMDRAETLKKALDSGQEPCPPPKNPTMPSGSLVRSPSGSSAAPKPAVSPDQGLLDALKGAIVMEKPNVTWDEVAGLGEAKMILRDTTEMPLEFPHLYGRKLEPSKGILLYGPPGTGKTYLAKAVAANSSETTTFLSISSANLVSKWVGESARLVRTLFTLAREKAPSVVFVDEIDSLCSQRGGSGKSESANQLLTEFLTQMDGVGPSTEGILVLGATNTPWELDRAVLSRFQKKVYIALPEPMARKQIIEIHLKGERHCLTDKDLTALAKATDRFSGRDLKALVQAALQQCLTDLRTACKWRRISPHPFSPTLTEALEPVVPNSTRGGPEIIEITFEDIRKQRNLREMTILPTLSSDHFERARQRQKASVTNDDMKELDQWTVRYGQAGE